VARNGLITRRNALHDNGVVLSGGSWSDANPLTNILDINSQIAAESTSNTATFTANWGVEYPIGFIGFSGLRTSSLGTMRVTLSGTGSYDTGTVTTWPSTGFAGLIDPDTGSWTLTGVLPESVYVGMGYTRVFIPSTPVWASSMTVDITDVGTSIVSIGVAGAYTVLEPPINFEYGWTLTPIDLSEVVRVQRGPIFVDKRGISRRLSLGFPYPEDDFWGSGFNAIISKGRSEPLWMVPYADTSEVTKWEKAAVYGLISRDSDLSNPFVGRFAMPIQIDQV
jgi:hypothetical protein